MKLSQGHPLLIGRKRLVFGSGRFLPLFRFLVGTKIALMQLIVLMRDFAAFPLTVSKAGQTFILCDFR